MIPILFDKVSENAIIKTVRNGIINDINAYIQ